MESQKAVGSRQKTIDAKYWKKKSRQKEQSSNIPS
jgi:hypothetical protein